MWWIALKYPWGTAYRSWAFKNVPQRLACCEAFKPERTWLQPKWETGCSEGAYGARSHPKSVLRKL